MNKNAVSTIVASVFVIMLSVFAVAILFTFVMPTVNDNLQSVAQGSVELSIQTSGGYTIWDETNKLAKVQIRRGSDNTNLESIRFQFIKEADKLEYTSTDIPSTGQVKAYSFILGDFGRPEGVKITAVVDGKEVVPQGQTEVGDTFGDNSEDSVKTGTARQSDIDNATILSPIYVFVSAGTSTPDLNGVKWYDSREDLNGENVYYGENEDYAYWYNSSVWVISNISEVNESLTNYFLLGDYPLRLTITGAGTASWNGVFLYGGDLNGRPGYTKDGDLEGPPEYELFWSGSQWWMANDMGGTDYASNEDLNNPPKTGWIVFEGSANAPTLTYSIGFGSWSGEVNMTLI